MPNISDGRSKIQSKKWSIFETLLKPQLSLSSLSYVCEVDAFSHQPRDLQYFQLNNLISLMGQGLDKKYLIEIFKKSDRSDKFEMFEDMEILYYSRIIFYFDSLQKR